MVEEALLQLNAVIGVERRPVRTAVYLEPFQSRSSTHEAFEVAARVQSLSAPVRCREERHFHFGEIRCALTVVVVDERARQTVAPHVRAIALQRFVGKRFVTAHELAGDAASGSALAAAMLDGDDLHLLPILAERAR